MALRVEASTDRGTGRTGISPLSTSIDVAVKGSRVADSVLACICLSFFSASVLSGAIDSSCKKSSLEEEEAAHMATKCVQCKAPEQTYASRSQATPSLPAK